MPTSFLPGSLLKKQVFQAADGSAAKRVQAFKFKQFERFAPYSSVQTVIEKSREGFSQHCSSKNT